MKHMNKKGNYPDVIEWIGVAISLVFVIYIVTIIYSNFDTQIQSLNDTELGINTSVVKAASAVTVTAFPRYWDYLFVFILLIFVIFSVTAARLIPSRKEFIFIAILAMILIPFVAMIIGNIWDGLIQQTAIAAIIVYLPFSTFLMDKLVIVALVYVTLIAVALLTKTGDET